MIFFRRSSGRMGYSQVHRRTVMHSFWVRSCLRGDHKNLVRRILTIFVALLYADAHL